MSNTRYGWRSGIVHAKGLKVNRGFLPESIWIPANQLSLQTSGTAATAGQQDDVPVTVHTHNSDDEATFSVLIPESVKPTTCMKIYVYWLSADTEGKTNAWDIDYRVTGEGSDVGAGSTSNVTTTDTDSTTANALNISSALTIPCSDVTPGSVFHGLLYNDNSEGTIDDDPKVVGLKIVFEDKG